MSDFLFILFGDDFYWLVVMLVVVWILSSSASFIWGRRKRTGPLIPWQRKKWR